MRHLRPLVLAPASFRTALAGLLGLALAGCGDPESQLVDLDGDGYFANEELGEDRDCNDSQPTVHPRNYESCDGLDNDCNDLVDDDPQGALEWFPDNDDDGFGTLAGGSVFACTRPLGYTQNKRDCNDKDALVFPNAVERCNSKDDDCDTNIDEGLDASTKWYRDADRDGFGTGEDPVGVGCPLDVTWVRNNQDCDDTTSSVKPNGREVCNGLDDDCDDLLDDADDSIIGARRYFNDFDGDSYGNVLEAVLSCTQPAGTVLNFDDCNDDDPGQNPLTEWWYDADKDGEGDVTRAWNAAQCWQPIGYVMNGTDCNDADPLASNTSPWHPDADRDGFGGVDIVAYGCIPRPGWTRDASDCDDRNAQAAPGQVEVCDHLDNDCDGLLDDPDPDVTGKTVFYRDGDADGYGVDFPTVLQCFSPPGFTDQAGDCDDTQPLLNPDTSWHRDADRDGYGDPSQPFGAFTCELIPGYAPNGDDCDDGDFWLRPSTPQWADLDDDGLGDFNAPLAPSCVLDPAASRTVGDCDDADAFDNSGGCFAVFGGVVEMSLRVDADADVATTSITLTCGGVVVYDVDLPRAARGQTIVESFEVATGDRCVVSSKNLARDNAGDGPSVVTLTMCEQPPIVYTPVGLLDDSDAYLVPNCSGCSDPNAYNYDPNALRSDPANCVSF